MFKTLTLAACIVALSVSCKQPTSKMADKPFIDSLIDHYTLPAGLSSNEKEIAFWKGRIDPKNPGMLNESKYAATLVTRFHALGDIRDLKMADSILRAIDTLFNHKEAHPLLSLVAYSIMQHRFTEADSFLQQAKALGLRRYEWLTAFFDVNFEIGRFDNAQLALNQLRAGADYGYYFRRSKMDHLHGDLDSALDAMSKAAALSEGSDFLKQVALSNEADLDIHAGQAEQAAELYKECIRLNSADFHSILGLGWVALVYDKDDTLAERLFQFVGSHNKLPDALYKLSQMADARGDSARQSKYATDFVQKATDPVYGNMYNKYLIELYTGILHDPAAAETLSQKELDNRATPQTYAWRVWSLFENNKKEEAYRLFQQQVSGKPLEGLELYYMGKMMRGLDKGYDALAFFKAADKNKYDLSPGLVKDLEKQLE
jgi:hypothetical protein